MTTLSTIHPTTFDSTPAGGTAFDVNGDNVLNDGLDATGCLHTQNTTLNESAWYALADLPSDFGNMDSLTTTIRQQGLSSHSNTTVLGRVRIYKSDKTSVLAAPSGQQIGTSTWTDVAGDHGPTAFSTLDTSAPKTDWDGALVLIEIERARVKGGNAGTFALLEVSFDGTYTPTAAFDPALAAAYGQPASPDLQATDDPRLMARRRLVLPARGLLLPASA